MIDPSQVTVFFERYAQLYNDALRGTFDGVAVSVQYAQAFLSVTPAGVMAGENDRKLLETMEKGFDAYRAVGTRRMNMTGVSTIPIDADHCVAKVDWSGDYIRKDGSAVSIPFTISYLLEMRDGALKVFGWIAGDEQAAFREHGLL